jgi:hypothetical protein
VALEGGRERIAAAAVLDAQLCNMLVECPVLRRFSPVLARP